MPSIGPMELAIVAIVALVIFGPKRLPELGSSLGRGMREFKSSIGGDNHHDRGHADESTTQRLEATASTAGAPVAEPAKTAPAPSRADA